MEAAFVRVDITGPVATVRIARPERLNALHPAAHREMAEAFDRIASVPRVRVVILTGEGRAFCAGYDIRDMDETGEMALPPSGFGGLANRRDYPIPIIAAVNGIAYGGGFELALACDLLIAAESATFSLPEAKAGWSPLGGGLQRLPRTIGVKRAMAMALSGRPATAADGFAWGFVNQVVASADLLAAAEAWADDICDGAPLAIRCNKEVIYASMDQPDFAAMMDIGRYPLAQRVMESRDSVEGKRAFAERRKPVWTGE